MAFGEDILKGFLGADYLKDYRHANKAFTSAGYALAPRLKYLFHVYFNINTTEIPGLTTLFGARDSSRISVLVKSVDLPSFNMEVETLNQYNRKRNIQTKVNYEPVSISFHDDSSDIIRSLWFSYYNYFYKDPSQSYTGNQSTQSTNLNSGSILQNFLTNTFVPVNNTNTQSAVIGNAGDQNVRDIYSNDRIGNDWGYIGEGASGAMNKPQFFKDITIYGFNQKTFVSYTLVNPIITDFKHDTYDYSDGGGTMSHTMSVKYESVKYGTGVIGTSQIPGFANPEHYDTEASSLSRPGSTNSFFGQGGILDSGVGVFEDLANGDILGAAVKGARTVYGITKMENPGGAVKEEVLGEVKTVIKNGTAVNAVKSNFQFLNPQQSTTITGSMLTTATNTVPVGTPSAISTSTVTSNGQLIAQAAITSVPASQTVASAITSGIRTAPESVSEAIYPTLPKT